jgi:hypothetical protein
MQKGTQPSHAYYLGLVEFYGGGRNNRLCKHFFSYIIQAFVGADKRTQIRLSGIIANILVDLLALQPRPLVARMQPAASLTL